MTDAFQPRDELPEPGPMIPPVPAIVLGVRGDTETRDDLTVCWTFIVEGHPPQIGVSVRAPDRPGGAQVALEFIREHRAFTLNVPSADWVEAFDVIDMCYGERADKFDRAGLTRIEAEEVDAPAIAEAPIVLECEVFDDYRLPQRALFFADVVRTSVLPGVTDESGRLDPEARPIFGMAAGNGEFTTLGEAVGHIGMSEGIDSIRY